MTIEGWARSSYVHKLIDKPLHESCLSEESTRKWGEINLARSSNGVIFRTAISIDTSGNFDCQIALSRDEVLLLAKQVLRDVPFSEAVRLLSDAPQPSKSEGGVDG
jgi:hypothetical protein